jgi:DegV family protein with EDD domain
MKETKALLERARPNSGAFFVVETLEYLYRGGRIGNAAHLLGTALNLKPILQLKNGVVVAAAKVRTQKKAIERMYTLLEKELDRSRQIRLGILHADAQEEAERVYRECQEHFSPSEIMITEVSPVIGTHTGPGTVGVAFLRDM